jgi:hypothetical protein
MNRREMNDGPGRGRGRRRSWPRWAAALAAMALIGPLATACAGGSSPASATGGPTHAQAALAYARCMRAHGVPNFPDPQTTNGGIGEPSGIGFGGDIARNAPQFQSADHACQHLMANAKGRGKS